MYILSVFHSDTTHSHIIYADYMPASDTVLPTPHNAIASGHTADKSAIFVITDMILSVYDRCANFTPRKNKHIELFAIFAHVKVVIGPNGSHHGLQY